MIRTMNTFTNAVQSTRRRSHAANLGASARSFIALALLTIATFAPAASWDDDSHYVSLGPRSGYYIVRPGSLLSHQLGVDAAPTIDTADPFRHGYGADARYGVNPRQAMPNVNLELSTLQRSADDGFNLRRQFLPHLDSGLI
jgi:hypothetical protein